MKKKYKHIWRLKSEQGHLTVDTDSFIWGFPRKLERGYEKFNIFLWAVWVMSILKLLRLVQFLRLCVIAFV